MKNIFIGIFMLAVSTIFAQAGEKNFIDQNYIEVTGKAEMEITPDMIYLSIMINEKEVKQPIAEKEAQMIKKLHELNIDVAKNLKVEDMGSIYKYLLLKKDIILTREYILMVSDAKTAGKVFQELEKIGISNVNVKKIDHSKIEQFRREVKVKATKAAKEKASDLAQGIGQIIGRAIFIQELNQLQNYAVNSNVRIRGVSFTSKDNSVPDLEFEQIHLEYSIMCRFELK